MNIIHPKDLNNLSHNHPITLMCYGCNHTFHRPKNRVFSGLKGNPKNALKYCSNKCQGTLLKKTIKLRCPTCNTELERMLSQVKKAAKSFCSHACAATYYNTHKKYGTNRSKLEVWIEKQLTKLYPNLQFHFNRKDAINSELDIYIPSLNLAFELNGIFHYEPIFGEHKLNQTQNNDQRKFQACLEHNIELCIIDTSVQKYFKEKSSQKYLDIITKIIQQKQ